MSTLRMWEIVTTTWSELGQSSTSIPGTMSFTWSGNIRMKMGGDGVGQTVVIFQKTASMENHCMFRGGVGWGPQKHHAFPFGFCSVMFSRMCKNHCCSFEVLAWLSTNWLQFYSEKPLVLSVAGAPVTACPRLDPGPSLIVWSYWLTRQLTSRLCGLCFLEGKKFLMVGFTFILTFFSAAEKVQGILLWKAAKTVLDLTANSSLLQMFAAWALYSSLLPPSILTNLMAPEIPSRNMWLHCAHGTTEVIFFSSFFLDTITMTVQSSTLCLMMLWIVGTLLTAHSPLSSGDQKMNCGSNWSQAR